MFVHEASSDRRVCIALRSDTPRRTPEIEAIRSSAASSTRKRSKIKAEQAKGEAARWQEGKQKERKGKTKRTAKPNPTEKKKISLHRAAKDSTHSTNDAKNWGSN